MNTYKAGVRARAPTARTLADALRGADVFVGLSSGGPRDAGDGEDRWRRSRSSSRWRTPIRRSRRPRSPAVRNDAIMATGRSDYPNQVNNVLGFPFIFRGALDVRARKINEAMKQAAVHALAELARLGEARAASVVRDAYPGESFDFGPELHHPEALRPARAAATSRPAVAQAAMDIGRRAHARSTSSRTAERLEQTARARSRTSSRLVRQPTRGPPPCRSRRSSRGSRS